MGGPISLELMTSKKIMLGIFVASGLDEVSVERSGGLGMNLQKNQDAEDLCAAVHSEQVWVTLLTWISQLASPPKAILMLVQHVAQ